MSESISINVLSVCTLSHVPYALVALRTCKKYSPEVQTHLFIADGTPDAVAQLRAAVNLSDLVLNVFIPEELSTDLQDIYLPCFDYYNAFEVSNLAKYIGLKHVLMKYPERRCAYIDADICFFGNIIEGIQREVKSPILLSPHQFHPSTDDVESEYLLHGWINSGFSVFDGSDGRVHQALDWLIHRIGRRGYLAPQFGLSGDQPWLSGVPFLFADLVEIGNNAGMNVAYWNMAERVLGEADGNIQCNGEKLVFFHFSGFIGAPEGRLTKHSALSVRKDSPLEKLCASYRAELRKVDYLHSKLSSASVLRCSKEGLSDRIRRGSMINSIYVDSPTIRRGFFSRIGVRVDAVIARLSSALPRIKLELPKRAAK